MRLRTGLRGFPCPSPFFTISHTHHIDIRFSPKEHCMLCVAISKRTYCKANPVRRIIEGAQSRINNIRLTLLNFCIFKEDCAFFRIQYEIIFLVYSDLSIIRRINIRTDSRFFIGRTYCIEHRNEFSIRSYR